MKKKNSKKQRSASVKPPEKPAQRSPTSAGESENDDGRLDFGGLPEIDFKKNLGCG